MKNLTKNELSFIIRVLAYIDDNKTASKQFNILSQIGYEEIPKELESTLIKLKKHLSNQV